MNWIKIDDGFTEHPKVLRVGKLAQSLFVDGLCYSSRQLTDGFIPTEATKRFGYGRQLRAVAHGLVEIGLWEVTDGGYQIHDYLSYQQSADKIRADRAAAKERMERLRSPTVRPNKSRSSGEVREQEEDREGDREGDRDSKEREAKASNSLSPGTRRNKTTWRTWDDLSEDEQAEICAYARQQDDRATIAWVIQRVNAALNQTASRSWVAPMQGLQNAIRAGVGRGELEPRDARPARNGAVPVTAEGSPFAKFG